MFWRNRYSLLTTWARIFGVCAVVLTIGVLLFHTPVRIEEGGGWKKYRILLVSKSYPLQSLYNQLKEYIGEDILSATNTVVSVHTYTGIEYIPIAMLPARLDPDDMRYDPYLQKIPRLFSTKKDGADYHVIYLLRKGNIFSLWWNLHKVLDGGDWHIVATDPLFRLTVLLLILGVVIWIAYTTTKRNRLWVVGGSVVIFYAIFAGNILQSILAISVVLPWIAYLSLYAEKPYFSIQLGKHYCTIKWYWYLLVVWLAIIALTKILHASVMYTLCGILFLISLSILQRELSLYKQKKREHGIFKPVRIISFSHVIPLMMLQSLSIAIIVLLWGIVSPLFSPDVPVPLPFQTDLSFKDLMSKEKQFPTLADYLTHEAFQQNFLFGKLYELPRKGDVIYLDHFYKRKTHIEKYREEVWRADDDWFAQTLKKKNRPALVNLLIEQGNFFIRRLPVVSRILHPFHTISLVFVVLMPSLVLLLQTSLRRRRYAGASFRRMLKGYLG